MKNLCRLLILTCCPLWTGGAPDPDQLLRELRPQGYVTDPGEVLERGRKRELEELLAWLERRTGAEMAVVVLPTLQGGEIRDFASRLFEQWGIGKRGRDNDLLILTALQERRIWVEVGYGLEGILPDGRVGRLLDAEVIPHFRQGDYGEGLFRGSLALARIIAREQGVSPAEAPAGREREPNLPALPLFTFFLVMAAFSLLALSNRRARPDGRWDPFSGRPDPALPWILSGLLRHGRGPAGFGGGFAGGSFGGTGGGFQGFGGGASGGGGAGRSW